MNDAEYALRKEIVQSCRDMNALGINQGTSGNIGVRWQDGLLITPSGLEYDKMTPEDIVHLHPDGSHDGTLLPSSEWRFHRDIIAARGDVNAVVHTHALYCTAIAMARRDIPAVHYMIAAAGGATVRCADYATFGTVALSEAALKALEGRMCCLLANHGMIACGVNLRKAMWLAKELETLAQQYVISLQFAVPVVLPDDEIDLTIEKFKSYGPRPENTPRE